MECAVREAPKAACRGCIHECPRAGLGGWGAEKHKPLCLPLPLHQHSHCFKTGGAEGEGCHLFITVHTVPPLPNPVFDFGFLEEAYVL